MILSIFIKIWSWVPIVSSIMMVLVMGESLMWEEQ